MRTISVPFDKYQYVVTKHADPIATVKPGEVFEVITIDAFSNNVGLLETSLQSAFSKSISGNPLTGPILVDGAKSGDVLAIKILDINPTRDYAVSGFLPGVGGLVATGTTPMLHNPIPDRCYIYKRDETGNYTYNDRLSFSWEPFIGSIATAPYWESIKSSDPFSQGGNMDVPDVKPGNILYLPVNTEGAFLYVGDVHARQGQGELCGVAMEIPAKVTLSVSIINNKKINWPRIESDTELMCIGSAKPMEDAARIAYHELICWMSELGWDSLDAYQALSQCGKLYVGNMVDTTYSLVAKIDKEIVYRT